MSTDLHVDEIEEEVIIKQEASFIAIQEKLTHHVDIIRARSVNKEWRQFISLGKMEFPYALPHLGKQIRQEPDLLNVDLDPQEDSKIFIYEQISYILQPSLNEKGWLIKVEEQDSGQKRLIDPLSHRSYKFSHYLRTLDLSTAQLMALTKFHAIRNQASRLCSLAAVDKVIVVTDSSKEAYVLFHGGKLALMRIKDIVLSFVGDQVDDIILYKGDLYAVDRAGILSRMTHPSQGFKQLSKKLDNSGSIKNLVESSAVLYLVDRYTHLEDRSSKVVKIKIYAWDTRNDIWTLTRNLEDHTFILGIDSSVSVLARELDRCQKNSIYFVHQHKHGPRVHSFHLGDKRFDDYGLLLQHSLPFCGTPRKLQGCFH